MSALIFSYKRSAALNLFLLAVFIAGVVCICLFVGAVFDRVLYLIAACVLYLSCIFVCYAFACRLLYKQIDDLLRADTPQPLQDRMRRLTRRMTIGSIKGALSVEYAYALLYDGKWKEGMIAASDAIVFAHDKIKSAAYVCLCAAYYGMGEKTLFDTFFLRAESYLKEINQKPTPRFSVAQVALCAMHFALSGEKERALERLSGLDESALPNVLKTAVERLKAHIAKDEQ